MQKAELDKDLLKIEFEGSGFQVNLSRVKSLSGRIFKGKVRPLYWTCPPSFENFDKLLEWRFKLGPKAVKLWENMNEAPKQIHINSIPGFGNKALDLIPRRYQYEALEFAEMNNGSCLIADDMGIGKTIEAMMYLAYHPELRPALIIPPSSVKRKWEREINKWMTGEVVQVIEGKKNVKITGSIVIANWDIIHKPIKLVNKKWLKEYEEVFKLYIKHKKSGKSIAYTENYRILEVMENSKRRWDSSFAARDDLFNTDFEIVIGDEVHKISNGKSGRTIAFTQLAQLSEKCIGLSGTPIKNRPIDFFNILKLVDPVNFSDWWGYTGRYCDRKKNGFGWSYQGSTNTKELHERVSRIMIRRLIHEVLPELPRNQRMVIPLEITNRKEYDKALAEIQEIINSDSPLPPGFKFIVDEKLKQLAVNGKIDQCIKWIEDYLESGKKLVVSCYHIKVADKLYNHFNKKSTIRITGGLGSVKKDELSEQFQNDPNINLAVCNIEAAGEGIDLFAADTTFNIEFRWDSTIHDQFERRVLRFGQESDRCFSIYPVAINTIEEDLFKMIDKKREVVDAVVDGKVTEKKDMFAELMNRMLNPRRRRR